MDPSAILQRLQDRFAAAIVGAKLDVIDPWIEVRVDSLPEVCRYLRVEPELKFSLLHCITSVDYFEPDAKKAAKVDWQPHLELVYHLSSLVNRHRMVLKVKIGRASRRERV